MIGLLPVILILFIAGFFLSLWSPLTVAGFLTTVIAIVFLVALLIAVFILPLAIFFFILKTIRERISKFTSKGNKSDLEKQFRHGLSFVTLSVYALFFVTMITTLVIFSGESGESGKYYGLANKTNISEIISPLMVDLTDKIPTLITTCGVIVVFFFFYGILGKNPNTEMNVNKKELMYYYTYEYVTLLGILLVFCSLIFVFHIIDSNDPSFIFLQQLRKVDIFQVALVAIAFMLLLGLTYFSQIYFALIEEYPQIEKINEFFLKSSFDESEPFTAWWNGFIQSQFKGANILSSYILVAIITVAFLSYYFNFNVISLLFFEIVLLFFHHTVSRISHIPRQKYTVSLQSQSEEQLPSVYILVDQSDAFVVLQPDNTKVKVLKGSILRIDETDHFIPSLSKYPS